MESRVETLRSQLDRLNTGGGDGRRQFTISVPVSRDGGPIETMSFAVTANTRSEARAIVKRMLNGGKLGRQRLPISTEIERLYA
ncbi:MAG TPA: hypothetical protein VN719_09695 [Gemmatimonadales bacterium]|nr:hypothetical protein [Gemmatimonadales bacterium]